MGNTAIRVEGLSKQYKIGAKQQAYRTLRDTITDALSDPFRRARSLLRGQAYGAAGLEETIWALRNISFDVKHGEVVGIIGRNGAGKSTLLKILSRITEPTEGFADVYGRVGSLLEVGTGFHPELTGRENIFLNGAILGMTRDGINRKFDEIVDFAGVERFIDTPVKHYSSGMGLRLGFAVAAYLEPEILVVDEVLAVGDAEFQKKCLGKMEAVATEGRTVLFVSHNIAAVQNLCTRTFVLKNGQVVFDGSTDRAISTYLSFSNDFSADLLQRIDRKGDGTAVVESIVLREKLSGNPVEVVISGTTLLIEVTIKKNVDQNLESVVVGISIWSQSGHHILTVSSEAIGKAFYLQEVHSRLICEIPKWPLPAGTYIYNIQVRSGSKILDWVEKAGVITSYDGDFYGTGKLPARSRQGVLIPYDWKQ